jgi:hypothetical protein
LSQFRTLVLVSLLLPLLAGGCRVRPYWLMSQQAELPPEAFASTPTLEDVIFVVNANTQRVQRLQTENATVRVEGIPALRANLAYEQPHNFRLLAQLSQFTGRELDIGSNADLFWFWIRRDSQPSVYYARHAAFAGSPARDLIPIEPHRLIDTLGLIYLDPAGQHHGPVARATNQLEITSRIPSPRGDMTRVLLIDARYGWAAQQHLYDANGQLLLSARADRQRYYRDEAVTLPHHIEVSLMPGQPSQIALEVDVGSYAINRRVTDGGELWAMPQIEGYPAVDIADPRFRPPVAALSPPTIAAPGPFLIPDATGRMPSVYGPTRTATLPDLRGYSASAALR